MLQKEGNVEGYAVVWNRFLEGVSEITIVSCLA